MSRQDVVLVADGNNILMRAVHASERSFMHHDGEPTGPLLLAINMLSRVVKEERPARMVVCFDGGRSAFRTEIFSGYKGDRSDRPADDKGPFSQFKDFLTLSGVHHVEIPGWEADDLIAAYADKHRDDNVVIYSGDKDMLQLLRPGVHQVRPTSSGPERVCASHVMETFGIPARRFNEYLALVGDPSDQVPGVRGIGPKKATALLEDNPRWSDVISVGLPEDKREVAQMSFDLVDLSSVPGRMRSQGIHILPAPHFSASVSPVTTPGLVAFLDLWGMASVVDRVLRDELWKDHA